MDKRLMIFYTITTLVFGYVNYVLFTEYAAAQWLHWSHYVFWAVMLVMSVGVLADTILNKTGDE